MNKFLIVVSIFITTATLADTNTFHKLAQTKPLATDTLRKDGTDPICNMKVKAGSTRTSTFDKLTYGFCSESCKKIFNANPKKYAKKQH